MVQEKYFDQSWTNESLVNKPSKKYLTTKNSDMTDIIQIIHKIEPNQVQMEDNISVEEKGTNSHEQRFYRNQKSGQIQYVSHHGQERI